MLSVITDYSVLIIVFNLQFCTEFTLTRLYALRYMFFHLHSTRYALKALPLHVPPSTLYAFTSLSVQEFLTTLYTSLEA